MKKFEFQHAMFIVLVLFYLISHKSYAIDYYITFSGSGESTAVDSVTVTNITRGISLTLKGTDVLHLTDLISSNSNQNSLSEFVSIHPNPSFQFITLSFLATTSGEVQISVYGADGRKYSGYTRNVSEGINNFRLGLPLGFYTLSIDGKDFTYKTKAIIMSSTSKNSFIEYIGQETDSRQHARKEDDNSMYYSEGDNLMFQGSGTDDENVNAASVVIFNPHQGQTVNFYFYKCKDANKNFYKTVKIGNQIWMSENLRTTRFLNGDDIPTTTHPTASITLEYQPVFQWAYNGNLANTKNNGRLYTWYSATDARGIAPIGWHVPDESDWNELVKYLADNKYSYTKIMSETTIAKSLAESYLWENSINEGAVGNRLSLNNRSGFSALPSGYKAENGEFVEFGYSAHWWTTSFDTETDCAKKERELYWSNNSLGGGGWCPKLGFSIRCLRNVAANTLPKLLEPSNLYFNSDYATVNGEIEDNGGGTITGNGFCWKILDPGSMEGMLINNYQNANSLSEINDLFPTINDFKINEGPFLKFKSKITGLTPNTWYCVRTFAINSVGVGYSRPLFFKTKSDTETIVDIDGNKYHTLRLGNQTWLVENLKTTRFRNGDLIMNPSDQSQWYSGTTPRWKDYNDERYYADIFGHYYNWFAVNDSRGLAPAGWHVATNADWTILQEYLIANGYNYDGSDTGNKIAKSLADKYFWEVSYNAGVPGNNPETNNSSGFYGLPGGYITDMGFAKRSNEQAYWWSSTSSGTDNAWYRLLNYSNSTLISSDYYTKWCAFPVRCVKDL